MPQGFFWEWDRKNHVVFVFGPTKRQVQHPATKRRVKQVPTETNQQRILRAVKVTAKSTRGRRALHVHQGQHDQPRTGNSPLHQLANRRPSPLLPRIPARNVPISINLATHNTCTTQFTNRWQNPSPTTSITHAESATEWTSCRSALRMVSRRSGMSVWGVWTPRTRWLCFFSMRKSKFELMPGFNNRMEGLCSLRWCTPLGMGKEKLECLTSGTWSAPNFKTCTKVLITLLWRMYFCVDFRFWAEFTQQSFSTTTRPKCEMSSWTKSPVSSQSTSSSAAHPKASTQTWGHLQTCEQGWRTFTQ